MCMFCAAIPAAAAVGARLEADQKRDQAAGRAETSRPILALTGGVILLLVAGSITYHSLFYR